MPEITDRIAEVLRNEMHSTCEWQAEQLAAVLVETLGLTPETAVRIEWRNPDRSIVVTDPGDIRSARKYALGAEVIDVERHVTRWERADA